MGSHALGGRFWYTPLETPESLARGNSVERREMPMVIAAQELVLLLLVGVSSTLLASFVDKSVDLCRDARMRLSREADMFWQSYVLWIGSSLVMCALSAACVQYLGPSAAGSGIPQMKCVLSGVQIHDYLSLRTLGAKVGSLVLALAGGLSIGKEGPYVHMASCLAHQLGRLPPFRRLLEREEVCHEVLAAACAAGVSATFGAPVGGVLFSIEVTSSSYSIQHLWKAMFTSVCGALVFRLSRNYGALALFRLTEFATQDLGDLLLNGEMGAFALLGVLCGVLGAAFVHAVAALVRAVRRVRAAVATSPQSVGGSGVGGGEAAHTQNGSESDGDGRGQGATAICGDGAQSSCAATSRSSACEVTADTMVGNGRAAAPPVARSPSSPPSVRRRASGPRLPLVRVLISRYSYTLLVALASAMISFPLQFFRSPAEDVINALFGAAPFELSSRWSSPSLLVNLAIYLLGKFCFTVIAVGCPVACGVFSPVFVLGAAFGRLFGELLDLATPEDHHITAGAYAVVGAAAMATGVTRTVSCAVMVFELTGQLNHMLPVLVAVLTAYGVGNIFNRSIYDTMLELNNLMPAGGAVGPVATRAQDVAMHGGAYARAGTPATLFLVQASCASRAGNPNANHEWP